MSNIIKQIQVGNNTYSINLPLYEVDAVTRPISAQGSNFVVYHITAPEITSYEEGLVIRVHKGLASDWPNDSTGAVKCIQINSLDPIAIFWRYDSFAAWNNFNNVYMTLAYAPKGRASTSSYYGYTLQAGFIIGYSYDSGNDQYSLIDYGPGKVGTGGLTQYSFTGYSQSGQRISIINADGTIGQSFVYGRGIQYYDGGAKSANTEYSAWTGNFYTRRVNFVVLQALVARWGLTTLTINDVIYLKCSRNSYLDTFEPVGLTRGLPSSPGNYYYIVLAKPYAAYSSTTGNEYWTMDIEHPIYYYKNGSWKQLDLQPRWLDITDKPSNLTTYHSVDTMEDFLSYWDPTSLPQGDAILENNTGNIYTCSYQDTSNDESIWQHIDAENNLIKQYRYYYDSEDDEYKYTYTEQPIGQSIEIVDLTTL